MRALIGLAKKAIPAFLIPLFLLVLVANVAVAARVKDLASVNGVRSNVLIGYGLVVGLNGTGDQTAFTVQSLRTMLMGLGVTLPPGVNPQSKNVAAVAVHAELPAFAKAGQSIDVTVSSIGNAGSLLGGALLMTPLRGTDGAVYGVAQGNLVVGGFGVSGKDGSRISVNVPSVGRIPNGAVIEKTVISSLGTSDEILLNLNDADFTTATHLVAALELAFGVGSAHAVDAVTVAVKAPLERSERVDFLSRVENLELVAGEAAAKVIINSRTGTIVMGGLVKVRPAAVAHGSLTVKIVESTAVSQPGPFSPGAKTVATPQSDLEVNQAPARMFLLHSGVSLEEIVRAVNEVGAAPGDLMAILEALKQAGALQAELEVI